MNPAERLHSLILAANKRPADEAVRDVWKTVLGVEAADRPTFYLQYAQLLRLVDEVKKQLESIDDIDAKLFLSWEQPVRNLLSPSHHNGAWKGTKTAVSEASLQALKFAAHELSRRPTVQEVPSEELQELQGEVEELLESVIGSHIDGRIKSLLIRQLETMRLSILAYRIRGAEAIRDALETSIGSVVLNQDILRDAKDEPEVKRFGQIIGKADRLVSLALKVKELAQPVFDLLNQ